MHEYIKSIICDVFPNSGYVSEMEVYRCVNRRYMISHGHGFIEDNFNVPDTS